MMHMPKTHQMVHTVMRGDEQSADKDPRDLKPKEKRSIVGDSDCLYMEIMLSGTKAWQFRQRLKNGEMVTTTRKTPGH